MMKSDKSILKQRMPFEPVFFNVRTLMQIEQKIRLAVSLEIRNIDVYCLSETSIRESGEVLQNLPVICRIEIFHMRSSRDSVASASSFALISRAEAALID